MGSFAWYRASEDLAQRYANAEEDDVDRAAIEAWQEFIRELGGSPPPAWQAAYSAFVLAVGNLSLLKTPKSQENIEFSAPQS